MSSLIFRAPDVTAAMAVGGVGGLALNVEGGMVQLPEGFDPAAADYVRAGPDLILTGADGTELVVVDYFMNDPAPVVMGEDGSQISGQLATRLAGPLAPGQVAGELTYGEAIGHVSTLSGQVTAVRIDGTRVTLKAGDSMYSGDVLETGTDSGVGIVLADGTSLSMAEDGRMVLDEMVYDPSTQQGSVSLSVLEGVFTIVSGDVAKIDPEAMVVTTPVGTIGIRGTQVGIDLTGEEGLTVVLMEEADGFVGEVIVSNAMGVVALNQAYAATAVQSYNAQPVAIANFSRNELTDVFGRSLGHLPTELGAANTYGQEAAIGIEGLADFESAASDGDAVPAESDFVTAAGEADTEAQSSAEGVVFGEELKPLDTINIAQAASGETLKVGPVAAPPPPAVEAAQEPVAPVVAPPLVPNTPPTAEVGTVMTAEDNRFSGQLAATDTEGGALTFALVPDGEPAHGTVTVNADGTFTYTPTQDYSGTDTFSYLVTDETGASATAIMTVTVTPVADVPQIATANVIGYEDAEISLSIAANMPTGTSETIRSVTLSGVPSGATLSTGTDNGNGTWSLTADQLSGLKLMPPSDYNGTLNLTVAATSTDGGTISSNFNATIAPVADVPMLTLGDVSGAEDSPIMLTIAAAMHPKTGETIESITLTGIPQGASLSAGTDNGNGSWTLHSSDLAGLILTPPTDYNGTFDIGVSVTSSDGGVATDTFEVEVGAVADVPQLAVHAAMGNEDASISLVVAANMPANTNQTLENITIGGVPQGATLSAGTDNGNGSWTLTPDQLSGLTLTPPSDYHGDFSLSVSATSSDGGTASSSLGVTVNPLPDTPQIALTNAVGAEDSDISLTLAVGMSPDTTETVDTITIGGVPQGATLSAGTNNGDGTWTLLSDQVSGLKLTPPQDYKGTFDLTITAVSTDGSAASDNLAVNVTPVADVPIINVSDVSGAEDSTIALTVAAAMADDTSETITSVIISGVPEGATLSAGTDNGNGTWSLTADDLQGLTLTPPQDYDGAFNLGVSVTSSDGGVATDSLSVHVGAVADVPILAVANVAGAEDSAIALTIAANMPSDTSETLDSVILSGVPGGATLSAGTDNGDGTWTLTPDQLSGLTLTPPSDFNGFIGLTVNAVSTDGGTATSAFSVGVAPVADHPILTVTDVVFVDVGTTAQGQDIEGTKHDDEIVGTVGADVIDGGKGDDVIYGEPMGEGGVGVPTTEEYVVPLDVNAALTDVDGSESLSLEISGIPGDAVLSLGTDNGDGTWTISGDDLDGLDSLSMTLPEGTPTDNFTLAVKAVAVEMDSGETATTESSIDIVFTGTADGAGDEIYGGQGDDEIHGGVGNDFVYGEQGDDQLYGDAGDDTLVGGSGDDLLIGGAGDDTLYGDSGDDVVVGGVGDDILVGGKGDDTFVFRAGDGDDFIMDLSEQDELRFEGPEFSAENISIQNNDDNTATITFGGDTGVSVTLNNADIEPGEGYTVTQDGDAVVVTFDEDSVG